MAYGLKVWNSSGEARVYDTSWLVRFHSSYSVTVSAGSSKNVYISGLDPNTWAVFFTRIDGNSSDVSVNAGYVRLVASSGGDSTFDFYVLEG